MKSYDVAVETGTDQRIGWDILRDSAMMRMLAAMDGRRRPDRLRATLDLEAPPRRLTAFDGREVETDRAYFRRRSGEERRAAVMATKPEARKAHRELADLYAALSVPSAARWLRRSSEASSRPRAEGPSKRQDALLDAALAETFPASDPVSVAFIR